MKEFFESLPEKFSDAAQVREAFAAFDAQIRNNVEVKVFGEVMPNDETHLRLLQAFVAMGKIDAKDAVVTDKCRGDESEAWKEYASVDCDDRFNMGWKDDGKFVHPFASNHYDVDSDLALLLLEVEDSRDDKHEIDWSLLKM